MFGSISIGLNPLIPNDSYWPAAGSGVVYLTFGNSQLEGEKNTAAFSWAFPMTNATVDGWEDRVVGVHAHHWRC
jgi:hypothetical protein